MSKLAIKGGKPIRSQHDYFPSYNTIGQEEKKSVEMLLDTGNLSQFLGAWHPDFYGGVSVQTFERNWSKAFGAKHAITVNSNTSGLFTAIGACGIQPGHEVIVSPYTMSASALAPLIYGAIPVFADIDEYDFCISPQSFLSKITPRTKAIVVVHIFGNTAQMDEIIQIARAHNIIVIEDCAQAPGALYKGKNVGTLGDIGVFSLNYHKHIHTGEGGVIVTNHDALAEKCQLIRNHGEAVADNKGISDYTNHWGYNYRMTEIEACIGIEQLKKLPNLLIERLENVAYFEEKIKDIEGLKMPTVKPENKHVYYTHSIKYNKAYFKNVHRNDFVSAIKAEVPSAVLRETTPLIGAGYVKPLYHQSLYLQKLHPAFMDTRNAESNIQYEKGMCAIAEQMHFHELITHEFIRPGMQKAHINQVIEAFYKVTENIEELL